MNAIKPVKAIVVMDTIKFAQVHDFHAVLGGYLEALPVGEGFTVFIDEDGKAKGLPHNERAESIIRAMLSVYGRSMLPGDYIVGPAIFVGIDDEGNECDLPTSVIQEFFNGLVED